MKTKIEIDDFYPYSFVPKNRYGRDMPSHPLVEAVLAEGFGRYEAMLRDFTRFTGDLLRFERDYNPAKPRAPFWLNGFLPGLDSIALYGIVATRKPRRYFEIGSGNSTKFAAAARNAHSPATRIVSIDPAPRAEIDHLCDAVVRTPLQDCDISMFGDLQAGDVLFIDGSHRVLQNSDVTVFFLEILPLLRSGVLVHLHDIFWPADYPIEWAQRMYSEQYMLGVLLLFAREAFDIVLPNAYVSWSTGLVSIFGDLWNAPHLRGIEPYGNSFWFSKT